MNVFVSAACAMLALIPAVASAQSCTASATEVNFGNVSPVRQSAVTTSGSITVQCTWNLVSTRPNVLVCLNVGGGTGASITPRYLVAGNNRLRFNLYRDGGYTDIWGSIYATGGTPLQVTLSKPVLGTSASATLPFYARIEPSQPDVPTQGNSNTVYANQFSGNETALNTHFYNRTPPPPCAQIPAVASTFPFTASATVVNDCLIGTTDVAFPATGVLRNPLTATGGVTVRCTNSDAWRIALNGGGNGNVMNRQMTREGGGGAVRYQLYTDASRTIVWGDGTGGSAMVTGTGTGYAQPLTVYGSVPAQSTPRPGNYSDVITATVSF